MANKFRGEAELSFTREVDGVEQPAKFKLCYDANAFCEIEDATEMNLGQLLGAMTDLQSLSMKSVRSIIFGGLLRHHPEITVEDAGDIMSDAGLEACLGALQTAFEGATKATRKGGAKPPKAK